MLPAIILLIAITLCAPRHAWRFLGYDSCISPSLIHIENINQTGGHYRLTGGTTGSFQSFVGYKYEISKKDIYVGLKYNSFLGFFSRDGSFDIQISCPDEIMGYNIYLIGENEVRLIWPYSSDSQ